MWEIAKQTGQGHNAITVRVEKVGETGPIYTDAELACEVASYLRSNAKGTDLYFVRVAWCPGGGKEVAEDRPSLTCSVCKRTVNVYLGGINRVWNHRFSVDPVYENARLLGAKSASEKPNP